MMLQVQGVQLGYQQIVVARDLTLSLPEGKITAIIGANGSGKSTLLRALARLLTPTQGEVILDGKPLSDWRTNDIAKRLSMLPQAPHAPDGLTVWDLVAFGRFPYRNWFGQARESDAGPIREALADVNLLDLADRPVSTLSGGQRQRVWIAMALAQQTQYLLLDEPTTYLDLSHQLDVMELVAGLNQRLGKTVVMVLHDLNLAARYAHHLIALKAGDIGAQGPPANVLTPEMLRDVFEIDATIIRGEHDGSLICVPIRAARNSA